MAFRKLQMPQARMPNPSTSGVHSRQPSSESNTSSHALRFPQPARASPVSSATSSQALSEILSTDLTQKALMQMVKNYTSQVACSRNIHEHRALLAIYKQQKTVLERTKDLAIKRGNAAAVMRAQAQLDEKLPSLQQKIDVLQIAIMQTDHLIKGYSSSFTSALSNLLTVKSPESIRRSLNKMLAATEHHLSLERSRGAPQENMADLMAKIKALRYIKDQL